MAALSSEQWTGSDPAKAGDKLAAVWTPPRIRRDILNPKVASPPHDVVIPRPDVLARRVLILGGAAMVAVSLAAWMAGLTREPGLGECKVTPAALSSVSHVNATIRMRSNTACAIPIANRRDEDIQIKIRPEHGVAALDAGHLSYRPVPQFRGRDFFMVTIRDRAARFDGTSIARVHVFVK